MIVAKDFVVNKKRVLRLLPLSEFSDQRLNSPLNCLCNLRRVNKIKISYKSTHHFVS